MTFALLIIALGLAVLARVEKVYRFRIETIQHVYSRRQWRTARLIYNTVSYDQMVWQFWRPLTRKEWYGDALEMEG